MNIQESERNDLSTDDSLSTDKAFLDDAQLSLAPSDYDGEIDDVGVIEGVHGVELVTLLDNLGLTFKDDVNSVEKSEDGDSIEDIESLQEVEYLNNEDTCQTTPKMTLENVAQWIKSGTCKKILVLNGAGISCSAGIPDFRTPGTGLYDNLKKYNLPYPEAIFDMSFYLDDPKPFLSLASELYPNVESLTSPKPTFAHCFLTLLQEKDLLLRVYTQNIDGLELMAGISEDILVECHGNFRSAACTSCFKPFDGKECERIIIEEQTVPICRHPSCHGGYVKPNIVFFGESLPDRFSKLIKKDVRNADLLLVMGTSLKVAPVSMIPEMVSNNCKRVLINRELVGDFDSGADSERDVIEYGNCDDGAKNLAVMLGLDKEVQELYLSKRKGINTGD